ncbi:hypothetical protein Plec18170_006365 [Paecilomyces lecythidis]
MGTGSSSEPSGEETLCLLVDDWREGEPSTVLLNDDNVPFDGPVDDCLNPRSRLLEFRFKFPANYPGGKHRFLAITQCLLSNKPTLGIKTLYLGKSAQKYADDLNKSVYGRVKWGNPLVVHDCQISWTEDKDDSSTTNFRFQIDDDEFAIAVVDRENPIFFGTLNNDKRTFVAAIMIPMRILLRVIWWRELFGNAGINFSAGSRTENESDDTGETNEWWWPIVLEAQQRAKAKAKAAAISASTSLPAAEEDSQEPSGIVKKKVKKNKGKKRKANHRNRGKNTTRFSNVDVKTETSQQQTPQSPSSPPFPTSPDYLSAYEAPPSHATLNTASEDQEATAVSDSGMVTCPTSPIPEIENLHGARSTAKTAPETVLSETSPPHSLICHSSLPQPHIDTPPTTHFSETGLEVSSAAEDNSVSDYFLSDSDVPQVSFPAGPPVEATPRSSTLPDTILTVTTPEILLSVHQDGVPSENQNPEARMASKTKSPSENLYEKPQGAEGTANNTSENLDQTSSIPISHLATTSAEKKEVSFTDELQSSNPDTTTSSAEKSISGPQNSQEHSDTQKDLEINTATASNMKKKHTKRKKRGRRQQIDPAIEENAEHQSCDSQTQVESCPLAQSSCPVSASTTTQVPISISDSSSLQPSTGNPKTTSGTLAKDSKSSLDPLASEYVPNFKSVPKTDDVPEVSKTSDANTAAKKKKKKKKSSKGRADTSSSKSAVPNDSSVDISNITSRDTTSPESLSSQPTVTDDLITQSITDLQDAQRSALLASRRNSTSSFHGTSTLPTETQHSREVVIVSRQNTANKHTSKDSDSICATNSAFQRNDPFETNISDNERPTIRGQIPSLSPQKSSSTRCSSTSGQPPAALTTTTTGRFSSSPERNRLPPIQEATIEKGQHDMASPSDYTYTSTHSHPEPDSIQDNSTNQTSDDLCTQSPEQTQGNPPATSQLTGSHASPASSSTTQVLSSTFGQGGPVVRRPAGFFWQLDSHGFPCAKADCDKRCNSWDGASVVCPRCGPFSEVRYCCQEHLYEDIKPHWAFCGQMTFCHPCRESTIPRRQKEGPPLLPSRHLWDSPERHRQAVYHATNSGGDYFIFADWAEFLAAGQPANNVGVRCTNRVLAVVNFDEPAEKDRFRRVLGVCLFGKPNPFLLANPISSPFANITLPTASIEVFNLVDYMFRLIRDNLRSRGLWTGELDQSLRYQMQHELAVSLSPETTGQRHACETEWDGRNRRRCADPVCRSEYRPLLGDLRVGGFVALCDYMESDHWLLRAARRTHPEVTQVAARTRGEGFGDVAEEDRRLFRRGEGWDGAGTGEMEIEGINA